SAAVCACLLSLRVGQPVISTLFPYTTLFRSDNGDPGGIRTILLEALAQGILVRPVGLRELFIDRSHLRRFVVVRVVEQRQISARDRKSTRLNSTHVESSYAVF